MTKGAFWNSVHESVQMLKRLNLLLEENLHQNFDYQQKIYTHPEVEIHSEIYKPIYEMMDYDILMYDYSIIQVSIDANGTLRMVYIQNPLKHVSLEEYLCSIDFPYEKAELGQIKYIFKEEYEQFRSEQPYLPNPVYLRYDVDAINRQNNENIHAYTHLHIGLNNNIRIPIGIELTPFSFVLFVLRHVYYDVWVSIIRKQLLTKDELRNKEKCINLPPELWTEDEKHALYIR